MMSDAIAAVQPDRWRNAGDEAGEPLSNQELKNMRAFAEAYPD
jgi:hypothetical protein